MSKHPPVKGSGFDREGGGFTTIHIGDKEYPARLIAAAPDMLDALREIADAAEHCGDGDAPVVLKARAAIAKAENATVSASERGP